MQRKLAAILAADVVGFSRLMESDEEATFETLRGHLQAAEQLVAEYGGQVFGGAGDSLIAEFPSVVQAVECALRIQQEIVQRNAEALADPQMQLRIGVNVGDIMVAEDGLYGDVVNVADRLQAIAPAGGVCISESVYHYVHKRLAAEYDDLGTRSIKNISEPLRVYRVLARGHGGTIGRRRRWGRHELVMAGAAAAAVAAIAAAGGVHLWRSVPAPLAEVEQAVEFPEIARPLGHFRVERPADLVDADAYTIYERIRDAMVSEYAGSGVEHAENYVTWRRYNTTSYLSSQHGRRYVNNYANDRAVDYGRFGDVGKMPPGSVIAKDSFEVTERGDVLTGPLFLMEKMPEGFSPETRDWRYTMIMPDGQVFGRTRAENDARVGFCAECHRTAGAANDHLFFLPETHRRRFLQFDGGGRPSIGP